MRFKIWLESAEFHSDVDTTDLSVQGDYLQDNWDTKAAIDYITTFHNHIRNMAKEVTNLTVDVFDDPNADWQHNALYDSKDQDHNKLDKLQRTLAGLDHVLGEFLNKVYYMTKDPRMTRRVVFDPNRLLDNFKEYINNWGINGLERVKQMPSTDQQVNASTDKALNFIKQSGTTAIGVVQQLVQHLDPSNLPFKIRHEPRISTPQPRTINGGRIATPTRMNISALTTSRPQD
jgi:hypothetical protein